MSCPQCPGCPNSSLSPGLPARVPCIFPQAPLVCRLSSSLALGEIFPLLKQFSAARREPKFFIGLESRCPHLNSNAEKFSRKFFIQLFDPEAIVSLLHLALAFALAQEAQQKGKMIASTLGMEMLLWAAAEQKIDRALKKAGAKTSADFLLFCSRCLAPEEKKELLLLLQAEEKGGWPAKVSGKKKPSEKASGKAKAKKKAPYSEEELLLEKIALSRLQ